MIAVERMEVSVVDIIDMLTMADGRVSAAVPVDMRVAPVDFVVWPHLFQASHNEGGAHSGRRRMAKRKPSKPPVKRNLAAKAAKNQKAGPMKDRRAGRGGARNVLREDLERAAE